MKTMFRINDGTKRRKYDKNTHKTMIIPDGKFPTNNRIFVILHPRNACKL